MHKIGILTSGGDCQGLNAAIRGICKALYKEFGGDNLEIVGFLNGYKGLIKKEYKILKPLDFFEIIGLGGTILGTSRLPFKKLKDIEDDQIDKVETMKKSYREMGLECLLVLGGNGTQKTANFLSNEGLNIISLPKTIDNDIWGTDMTFGFHSAVNAATLFIDNIYTTAKSHGRIFIVEIMGHKVGWLTLYAGIAGGADIILIPEIPYNAESILKCIENNRKEGKNFSIIAMAEGASSNLILNQDNNQGKKKSVSYELAIELSKFTTQEIKVAIPGHYQRGGSPCPYDRILATEFGAAAAELVKQKAYGKMVSLKNGKISSTDLNEIAGKLKAVPYECDMIKNARNVGICFGEGD